jgi:predicted RNase H-like HicB family nuclease
MTHYIALIHKEADNGYGVSFPDVPGVIAVADTLDEALREAGVALGFAFEDWQGDRPSPRTLDELHRDATFLDWSADAVVAAVAPENNIAHAA